MVTALETIYVQTASDGLDESDKIALGVGIGIGLPATLAVLYGCFRGFFAGGNRPETRDIRLQTLTNPP